MVNTLEQLCDKFTIIFKLVQGKTMQIQYREEKISNHKMLNACPLN